MTEKLLSPLRTRTWPERWLIRTLGAALASAAYFVCVAWTGASVPGALVLAVLLLLLAGYLGRRDDPAWPVLLVAVPPAGLMYVTHPRGYTNWPDEAEWPQQWAFATLVIGVGVLVASAVGRRFRPCEEDSTEGVLSAHGC
ncbi:hypothetical protein [Streptomyces sp. STR69]|uniref:hypothetical protein n=1 Tax=Streptomyces sp. STR69 TaxID=1796942 RepID=UPI0021CAC9DE|nr:hypothetical protein [Streptomyces sp. STR69]